MADYYSNLVDDELQRIEQYRKVYEITNPYPEDNRPNFIKELGIEAGALIASAVGSIVLSAIRTSTIFMLTEALLIEAFDHENLIPGFITAAFPMISMIVSLVAFEGMLAAHGFIKGKHSKSLDVSPLALWLCFGVTITAGLAASFGLLNLQTDSFMFLSISWVLAVLTAVGAPVVAYYGSLNLGIIINRWLNLKNGLEKTFTESVRSWNKGFQSSFSGKKSEKLFGERSSMSRTNIGNANERSSGVRKERSQGTNAGNETRNEIISILDEVHSQENRIAGTSEVARILSKLKDDTEHGFEKYKGYVHKVRKDWLVGIEG